MEQTPKFHILTPTNPTDRIQIKIDSGDFKDYVCELHSIAIGFEQEPEKADSIPLSFYYEIISDHKKSLELEQDLSKIIIDILSEGIELERRQNRNNDSKQSDTQ